MQRGDNVTIALRRVLDRLGDKWSVRAIGALLRGPRGFVEIRRELDGVSHKVLSYVLRSLERDGYSSRRVVGRSPLRVEYRLTPLGHAFAELLARLEAWAAVHQSDMSASRRAYDANNPVGGDEPPSVP